MADSDAHLHTDLASVSDKISAQVRFIAVSILAVVWALLLGGEDAPAVSSRDQIHLLIISIASIGTLTVDYIHYLFGFLSTREVLKRFEAGDNPQALVNYRSFKYRVRVAAFWLKQVLALGTVIYLGLTVARIILAA